MRAQAALTAFAFALASLLGVIHEATTRHVVCAAHGELIHADAPTKVAKPPAGGAVASARTTASTHGDDHCALASATHQSRVTSRAPAMASAVAPADTVVAVVPAGVPRAETSLYRTAPKTSPPA